MTLSTIMNRFGNLSGPSTYCSIDITSYILAKRIFINYLIRKSNEIKNFLACKWLKLANGWLVLFTI